MERFLGYRGALLQVYDDQVRVRAYRDRSFGGIDPEQRGRVPGCQPDELLEGDPAAERLGHHQRKEGLDPYDARGRLQDVPIARGLVVRRVRRVVGGDAIDVARPDALPQGLPVLSVFIDGFITPLGPREAASWLSRSR